MSVNIDGMFLVAQAVGRQMQNQGTGGSIIQTASIYGLVSSDKRIYEGSFYLGRQSVTRRSIQLPKPRSWDYPLSCCELGRCWNSGKRFVPAGVESGQNDTFKARYSARVPLARMAQPDEMVGALIYLASDASSYVTGHCLVVDGGLSVW